MFLQKKVKRDNFPNETSIKERREKKEKEKKEKEKEKENSQKSQDKESAEKDKEKEEKPKKNIEISINLIRLISNRANSFLDKNDIDQAVFEYYKNNDDFGKMFALMLVMDEIGLLTQFSKYFADRMDEFKEKKYIFDINGTTHDYSTQESQQRLREYVQKSETKYYSLIEGAYNYCLNLKSIKVDDSRDNSKIIEDYDNEESDGEGDADDNEEDQKSKSSIDMENNKEFKEDKEEKEDIDDKELKKKYYESNSEDEDNSKDKKKKKVVTDEEEDIEDDNEDEEESKNDKKKNKNSRKKKAEDMKPKHKKSQTYKNKKK